MPRTDPDQTLDAGEYRRYGRHLALPEVGEAGQLRLRAASVLIVGAGGLGSPAALYLAAAGVGRITIADFDVVDLSNLQRQVLFATSDIGTNKAQAAALRLAALNPEIRVDAVPERIGAANVERLVGSHDVVLDGSDNFGTRYLVNDACRLGGRPYVYGSIHRFEGQVSVFRAPGPCYRCLFPEPPPEGLVPNCAQAGVLGVLPGIVGSLQASETLKLLLGLGTPLLGRLLLVNALSAEFREVRLRRDPACALCGDSPSIRTAEESAEALCLLEGGTGRAPSVSAAEFARLLAGPDAPFVIDVREPWEFHAGAVEGSRNIPLGEVSVEATEIPRDRSIVVLCRNGPRGERAAELLIEAGFARVRNLEGGLLAWRNEAAPSLIVP